MRVLVLHSDVPPEAPVDEQDTLLSAQAVAGALEKLGHHAPRAAFMPDIAVLKGLLETHRPDAVFNLVESVFGAGIYSSLAPAMLERLGVPFTGGTAAHFAATTDKPFAKHIMRMVGLATPDWCVGPEWTGLDPERIYVVKAADEDGSAGLEVDSVLPGSKVRARVELCKEKWGGRWFAEAYVDGREFNITVMEGADGPQVFPLAEMKFVRWPEGRPKLVSFSAKWVENTFDWDNMDRRFGLESEEPELAKALFEATAASWRLFDLRGYARVDFRVDPQGKPWILEINPNCCISPDAGLADAALKAGLSYEDLIARVVEAALRG